MLWISPNVLLRQSPSNLLPYFAQNSVFQGRPKSRSETKLVVLLKSHFRRETNFPKMIGKLARFGNDKSPQKSGPKSRHVRLRSARVKNWSASAVFWIAAARQFPGVASSLERLGLDLDRRGEILNSDSPDRQFPRPLRNLRRIKIDRGERPDLVSRIYSFATRAEGGRPPSTLRPANAIKTGSCRHTFGEVASEDFGSKMWKLCGVFKCINYQIWYQFLYHFKKFTIFVY